MAAMASGLLASLGKKPGQMQLTVMPFCAHSVAIWWVKLITAPLLAA